MYEILVEAVAEVRSVAESHPRVPWALMDLGLVELCLPENLLLRLPRPKLVLLGLGFWTECLCREARVVEMSCVTG
jgi:hypothetical protein